MINSFTLIFIGGPISLILIGWVISAVTKNSDRKTWEPENDDDY